MGLLAKSSFAIQFTIISENQVCSGKIKLIWSCVTMGNASSVPLGNSGSPSRTTGPSTICFCRACGGVCFHRHLWVFKPIETAFCINFPHISLDRVGYFHGSCTFCLSCLSPALSFALYALTKSSSSLFKAELIFPHLLQAFLCLRKRNVSHYRSMSPII